MISTEQRIQRLEQANKQRKSSHPVAGSLVPTVQQSSGTYSKSGGNNNTLVFRIRFTPTRSSPSGYNLITLSAFVSTNSNLSSRYIKSKFFNEPQSGNGSVVVRVEVATVNQSMKYYVKVTSSGTSGGSFSLL